MIQLDNIKKVYKNKGKDIVALNNISLSINEGEIVGLVGPNGAGKSTTVKVITGILKPDEGMCCINGIDSFVDQKKILHDMGVFFGNRSFLWYNLPVKYSFKLMKSIYSIESKDYNSRLNYLIDAMNIAELLNRPVSKMSLGQRVKCELVATLLHNPSVIILDEPTIGLDINAKQSFRDFIKEYTKLNKTTVIFTSHDLGDVEKLCDRVVLIKSGEIKLDLLDEEIRKTKDEMMFFEIDKTAKINNLRNHDSFREEGDTTYKFLVHRSEKNDFIQLLEREYNCEDYYITNDSISLEDLLHVYYK